MKVCINTNEDLEKNNNNLKEKMNIDDILLYLKNIEMKLENKIKDILTIISIKLPDCKDNELLSEIKKKETNFEFQIEKLNTIEKQFLKINDRLISQELKLEQLQKEITNFTLSINKTINEHFSYPGIIGKFSKFKNIPDFLCYINETISILVNFKDKMNLDYNSYIKENNNYVKQINFRVEEYSRSNLNFFNKTLNQHIQQYNENFTNFKSQIQDIKDLLEKCKNNQKDVIIKYINEKQDDLLEKIKENHPVDFSLEINNFNLESKNEKNEINEHNFFSKILNKLLYKSWNEIQTQINEIKEEIVKLKVNKEKELLKKNKKSRIYSSEKKNNIILKDKELSNIQNKKMTLNISKSQSNLNNHLPNPHLKKTLQPNFSSKNLLKKEETKISFMVPENNKSKNTKNTFTKTTDNINNNIKVMSTLKNEKSMKNKLKPNFSNESYSDEENISPNSNIDSNQISTEPILNFNNKNQTFFFIKKNNDKIPQIQINNNDQYETNNGNRRINPVYTHKFKDSKISLWKNKNNIIQDKNKINREINRNKTVNNNINLMTDFLQNSDIKKSKEKLNKIPITLSYNSGINNGKKLNLPIPINPGN